MGEKLGILGPAGTHSEAAAVYLEELLGNRRELVTYGEIYEALHGVENGEVDAALVPVENSLEGSVNVTLDILAESNDLLVARELVWPVRNFLMGKGKTAEIKKIISHAQPISQCRRYLRTRLPQAQIVTVASTAKAAQTVSAAGEDSGMAAICSRRAGEINGLSVIAADIQDNQANSTRFFEVRHKGKMTQLDVRNGKMLIICQIDGHSAGSLCGVLEEFSRRRVNLTRIESRPARTRLGEYIFFFDLETDNDAQTRDSAVAAVRQKSIWLKNLGEFPVYVAEQAKE